MVGSIILVILLFAWAAVIVFSFEVILKWLAMNWKIVLRLLVAAIVVAFGLTFFVAIF